MSGILLLIVAALWLLIAFFLAKAIAHVLPKVWWAYVLRVVVFLALLPLPLIDEIVGKSQFEQLCRENSTIQLDRAKTAGKTVYLADQPSIEAKGTWVSVVIQPWRYVDATTGETVVSYNTLQAGRRFFLTHFGTLTFNGYCAPGGRVDPVKLFKEIGVTQVQRSELRARDKK